MKSTTAMRRYCGGCHCQAVRFRFRSELITSGLCCNCSICTRKGVCMSVSYFGPDRFELLAGEPDLTVYRFGDHLVNHYFCRHCGIHPFHAAVQRPGHYRVNLGCVAELELADLEIDWIDGRSF